MDAQSTGSRLTSITPCFIVRDVMPAISFYRDQLGFEMTFLDSEQPALVRAKNGPEECARWAVVPLDAGAEVSAACVVEKPTGRVRCFEFS